MRMTGAKIRIRQTFKKNCGGSRGCGGIGLPGFRWYGVAAVVNVVVFWLLLRFNRMMQVLKRMTGPLKYVASAVMNMKLKRGVSCCVIGDDSGH
jgi:hypothetical protein